MKEELIQIREQLYQKLHHHNRADAILDLIEALCSAQGVQSPTELTLLPTFRGRHYSALYQGVADFALQRDDILSLLLPFKPASHRRPFRLYSVDIKPLPRPYAACLQNRHFVHPSTPIPGQKPITVGHAYSLLAYLPEKEGPKAPPWPPPYDAQRVSTTASYLQVARQQCQELIQHHRDDLEHLLFLGHNGYCRRAFIYPLTVQESANVVVRLRNNRVVYGQTPTMRSTGGVSSPLLIANSGGSSLGSSPMAPLGKTPGRKTRLIPGAGPIPHLCPTGLPAYFVPDGHTRPTPQIPRKIRWMAPRTAAQTAPSPPDRPQGPQKGRLAHFSARLSRFKIALPTPASRWDRITSSYLRLS